MRKSLLSVSIILCLCACNKFDIPKCDFDDATQDLSWLADIIDEREANPTDDTQYCYITQAKFKRKSVFILRDCNPLVNKAVYVQDCESERVQDSNGTDVFAVNINDELTKERIIWQPDNFSCSTDGNATN